MILSNSVSSGVNAESKKVIMDIHHLKMPIKFMFSNIITWLWKKWFTWIYTFVKGKSKLLCRDRSIKMNDSGYLNRRMATTGLFLRHTCEKFHTLLLSKPLRSMMTCSLAVGKVWGSLHCIHRCSMISCKWVISVSKLTSWSYKCTRIYHVYIIKKFDWLMMVNWGGGGGILH